MCERRLINLDQASTSDPKPDVVWESIRDYLAAGCASPGRGGHVLARRAGREVERSREILARVIGTADPSRISFTANATHALNTCLKGVLRPGDRVVTTAWQHNSVLRPLEALRLTRGIEYDVIGHRSSARFGVEGRLKWTEEPAFHAIPAS